MAPFDPTTHKLIRTGTGNLGDAGQVDPRVMLAKLVSVMGFSDVTISNTAPADKKTLWWHKDVKAFKRYNPIDSSWGFLTADQYALHLLHRSFTSVVQEVSAADDDWVVFWDTSLGESKGMTIANLKAALSIGPGWTLMSTTSVSGTQPYLEVSLPLQSYNELQCVMTGFDSASPSGTSQFYLRVVLANNTVLGPFDISTGGGSEPISGSFRIDGNNAAEVGHFYLSLDESLADAKVGGVTSNVSKLRFYCRYSLTDYNLTAGTVKLFMR